MARIFVVLSLFALVVLTYACIDGLLIGDYRQVTDRFIQSRQEIRLARAKRTADDAMEADFEEAGRQFTSSRDKAGWHMLAGTAAALIALLVHCLSVTYFIGTGRWCKEVCETYKLESSFFEESDRLKRRTFPWSVVGILLLLAIVSTGPPSDPLLGLDHSDAWASAHRYISIGATVLMAGAFFRQVVLIREHYGVIGRILERVKIVRAERGLDTEEETSESGSA